MRPFFLLVLVCAVSVPAAGQIQRAAPAFEVAVSPWFGITSFGQRQTSGALEASYRGSITVGIRGDMPLTQRLGLLANVAISPTSKQRVENPVSTELREGVTSVRADLALGWRFIPRAPVFFFAGGGVLRSSLPAFPDFDQSVTEPRGLLGVGYDRPATGRWNFRVTATGFITKPAETDASAWTAGTSVPEVEAESTAFDWAVELGARYRFRGGS